jgi:predicted secreted protein
VRGKTLLLILMVGCAANGEGHRDRHDQASTTQAAAPDMRTIRESDSGAEIRLKIGQLLHIELPAQLGTGQTWRLVSKGQGRLKLREGFPQYVSEQGKPGARQTAVFAFEAFAAGEERVELEYGRPNAATKRRFMVAVVVEPSG